MKRCQAYQIGTGRKIHIEMRGDFGQDVEHDVEHDRIIIEPAPGSTIKLIDNGPPAKKLEYVGPARVDVEEFHFNENSQDTDVDLERSRSGAITDLYYNHQTAELTPIHGAKVSTYATHGEWGKPSARNDYPSEQECQQKLLENPGDTFNKDDLKEAYSIFCIKTAEGDLGFIFLKPDSDQKPLAYYAYTYTWVR